jgi:hypothetical protein
MLRISSYLRWAVTPVVCASLVLLAGQSGAQQPTALPNLWWTASGSTGIVDEADTSELRLDTATVGFSPTAPAESIAVVRYPLNYPLYHNFTDGRAYVALTMSYERPDDWSYAAATLKRVHLTDGAPSVVLSVNAWDQPPTGTTQVVTRATRFDGAWRDYAYYVEVVLWKPEATNNPKVVGLKVIGWASTQ